MSADADLYGDVLRLDEDSDSEHGSDRSTASEVGAPAASSRPEAPAGRRSVVTWLAAAVVIVACIGGGFAVGRMTAPDPGSSTTGDGGAALEAGTDDAATLLQVALELHRNGDLVAATKAYEAVLLVQPDDQFALYNLGLISQTGNDFDQAIIHYTRALEVDPTMMSALNNRGLAHRDAGQLDAAIVDLRAVLAADPTSAAVMYNLGNVLIANGAVEEGAELVAQAVVLDPTLRGD
ncbi:MAG: tetratricopeptide repeat protein [Actinomycetota bacterium]|nr:tetratricopeptide repeat protein [Actinomycetota bacterium]